jgi:hypothetical protein
MVVIVIAIVVLAPVGIAMINGQRTWHTAYDRIYADVITDSYVASERFDSIIRKAAAGNTTVDEDGEGIEAQYYDDIDSTFLDRYAHIYVSGESLVVEYGTIDADRVKTAGDEQTLCGNVSSCTFQKTGSSAQMVLTLDNGTKSHTVCSSALMHN